MTAGEPDRENALATEASGADRLIQDLGCESSVLLRNLDDRLTYKVCKDDRNSALKIFLSEEEADVPAGVLVHSKILREVPRAFRRLVIPSYEHHGFAPGTGHFVVTSWLEGRHFNDRWDELQPDIMGGRAIEHDTIDAVVGLLEDLRSIPVEGLLDVGLRQRNREFDESCFNESLGYAVEDGLLSSSQCKQATGIVQPHLESFYEGGLMLSNSDFQFRNLVEISPTRTGLVDWDAGEASGFEIEHCVAYMWILMWNNPFWRHSFLREARARFDIDRENFRGILVMLAVSQMTVWRTAGEFRLHQVDNVINSLDDRSYKLIWGG